ncbi:MULTISPECIES: hypothetical protein [Bordetella]|uniref:hypothetical protein n=1 Tax=Bordetella TaxID=517 RepID=UPI0011400566|nr:MULTISPECIES: hypothetical protein [Bordetella]
MNQSKWPEASAIIAVAAAAAVILGPWGKISAHIDWTALSAVGTLLAVAVAIAVPALQHRSALRANRREKAMRDCIAMTEMHAVATELIWFASEWQHGRLPAQGAVRSAIRQIESGRRRATSLAEAWLYDEALAMARDLESSIESAMPDDVHGADPEAMEYWAGSRGKRLQSFHFGVFAWGEEVVREATACGIELPPYEESSAK